MEPLCLEAIFAFSICVDIFILEQQLNINTTGRHSFSCEWH